MHAILKKLTGGTRRSLGRTNEVVAEVLARPSLFRHLFAGLTSNDEVLRMRAADAIEKITIPRPDLLIPFKKKFLAIANRTQQPELRWHAALILPRLKLTASERAATIEILFDYLRDPSSIVKTCAMQALADLAFTDAKLKSQIRPLLEELTQIGTPAMRAQGRKLLRQF
jgi:HEAT repeat protein